MPRGGAKAYMLKEGTQRAPSAGPRARIVHTGADFPVWLLWSYLWSPGELLTRVLQVKLDELIGFPGRTLVGGALSFVLGNLGGRRNTI